MKEITNDAQLFEYAILWLPSNEEKKEGKKAKVLVEVKRILASDEKSAFMLAARDIPNEFADSANLDQIQIALRPF